MEDKGLLFKSLLDIRALAIKLKNTQLGNIDNAVEIIENEINKLLKVVKICYEKDVDITCLKFALDVRAYNHYVCKKDKLTQEEFVLLKEVMEKYGR